LFAVRTNFSSTAESNSLGAGIVSQRPIVKDDSFSALLNKQSLLLTIKVLWPK